ncbi:MAG: zinc ABC transporter substrate-binding protein ZnuA [Hyphomicrobiales bacterium]|nr:zinc ABC transporter substrate-binding protein ZnuA [Hyphomicrobiales bacterium]MCP5001470.1 zinc ABC transporter substrate-binding protein ZnuA [Hyphomicrobiales bacterium]
MKSLRSFFLGSVSCLALPVCALAEPSVVASIKPIHSLVSGVMAGVGEPEIIVDGAASPHTYSLRPSQAGHLEEADLVFWVGPQLEAFLEKSLETLGRNAAVVNLSQAHGLELLKIREGGTFEDHDHSDSNNANHAGHDDHGRHGAHDEAFNAHIWLDPDNAKALVQKIEEALVEVDPDNADRYAANARDLTVQLDSLTTEVTAALQPVQGKSFVVFHDAYPYFENRFEVSAAGSVTVSPEVSPGAARVSEIRDKVKELGVACVFSEPQFEPKLIQVITEGTTASAGVLDPLGAKIENGRNLYFELIRSMARDMRACLSRNS